MEWDISDRDIETLNGFKIIDFFFIFAYNILNQRTAGQHTPDRRYISDIKNSALSYQDEGAIFLFA